MAFSTQSAVSDGTLVTLLLTINYIDQSDVTVFIDDVEQVVDVDYEWVTDNSIEFLAGAVADGSTVLLVRRTQLEHVLNVFAQGATFNNVTMDENFQQLLYVGQEAQEGGSLTDVFNDVDMHGNTFLNLAPAVAPTSPVTLAQLNAYAADSAAVLRADLASATDAAKGSGLVGSLLTFAGAVGRSVSDRALDSVSLFEWLTPAEITDVRSFTGSVDITAKVQTAIDSGLNIFCPPGLYLASPLYLPHNGELNGVVNPDGTIRGNSFIGTNQTVFKQVDNTKPVLQKTEENGRLYNWTVGPIVFMPAAGGSAATAFDLSGMTFCTFNQIRGVSNGTDGFYSLVRLNSSPVPGLVGGQTRQCHGNTLNDITLEGVAGYTKMIDFDDGGLGASYYANANLIQTPKCFNCGTALTVAIDAEKAYGIEITGPVLELCPNAVGIKMGDGTLVTGGAIEMMLTPFDYASSIASRSTVIGTAITNNGTNEVTFHAEARSNTWHLVNDRTGHTWINGGGKGNKKHTAVRFSAGAIPSGISIARVLGATGTVTQVTAVTQEPWTAENAAIAFRTTATFAATSTAIVRMSVGAPANPSFAKWKRTSQEFGVFDGGGLAVAAAPFSDSEYSFSATSGVTYTMSARVQFKLVHDDAAT